MHGNPHVTLITHSLSARVLVATGSRVVCRWQVLAALPMCKQPNGLSMVAGLAVLTYNLIQFSGELS